MESSTTESESGDISQNRWQRIPTWGKRTIGIVAALLLVGLGGALGNRHQDSLKQEVAALTNELQSAEAEAKAAKRDAARVAAEEKLIKKEATAEANEITAKAKSEAASIGGKLSGQRQELQGIEGEVSEAESSLTGAKEEKAKSTITDGTWQAEVDYIPGTYEAEGGASCYWALLSEPGGGGGVEGIIENGGFNKHQILSITSPYFETRDCGTWHRTG